MTDSNTSLITDIPNSFTTKLFGFLLPKKKPANLPSVVPPLDEDASGYSTAPAGYFGQYLNLEQNDSKDNIAQVRQYRGVAMHPEVDEAIDNIINEAITSSEKESTVSLNLDKVDISSALKKNITKEFDAIVNMLKFNELGYDIFRRWYVDGRLYHHLVVEKNKEKDGIKEIRPIDACKIRKIKEVVYKKDNNVRVVDRINEYFVYSETMGIQNNTTQVKLTPDSVSYVTSGLLDVDRKKVVSHLHKALKTINQLRMMEDSLVIYRLARAPERRLFYIDVGNMPRAKAEEYMKSIMARYRNKIVYDAETGNIKDDRKHMSMLEDFWLPRREGGRGTEISTLPGGENLGQIEDIVYFQKKLYQSLNVPISRLQQETGPLGLGRPSEITRDELKFQKFIDRLRKKFSYLFIEILHRQLILKNIFTEEDWNEIANDLSVDYLRDNFFSELKNTEIMRERLQTLDQVSQHVGVYVSKSWVMKNILKFTDEEIEQIQEEIQDEATEEQENNPAPEEGGDDGGQKFSLHVKPSVEN